MRPAALLLVGLVLAGAGVAVLLSHLPGHWWIGITLLVAGLLVKLGGFLITDDPVRARPRGRRVTTLDGQVVEVPRPGVPTGRAALDRGARARHAARVSPPAPVAPPPTRRAG